MLRRVRVHVGEHWYVVELTDLRFNPVRVLVDGEPVEVHVEGLPAREGERGAAVPATPPGPGTVMRAPMAGVVVSVRVTVGQRISAGDPLYVLEAIKLEQTIRAPVAGIVQAIHVTPGQSLTTGQLVVELGSAA